MECTVYSRTRNVGIGVWSTCSRCCRRQRKDHTVLRTSMTSSTTLRLLYTSWAEVRHCMLFIIHPSPFLLFPPSPSAVKTLRYESLLVLLQYQMLCSTSRPCSRMSDQSTRKRGSLYPWTKSQAMDDFVTFPKRTRLLASASTLSRRCVPIRWERTSIS